MNAQGCRCVQATVQVPRSPVPVASVPWPRENAPAPHATRWSRHRRAPRRPLHGRAATPLHPSRRQRSLTTPGPSTLPVAAIGTAYSTQFRPAVVWAYLHSLHWGVALKLHLGEGGKVAAPPATASTDGSPHPNPLPDGEGTTETVQESSTALVAR